MTIQVIFLALWSICAILGAVREIVRVGTDSTFHPRGKALLIAFYVLWTVLVFWTSISFISLVL